MPSHHTHQRNAHRAGHAAKRREPGPVHLNAVERALTGACRLPRHSVAEVRAAMDATLTAFGRGQAPADNWRHMADALNVAEQLAELRICSDEGSRAIIRAAQQALADVHQRQAHSGSWTLRGTERKALDDGLWLHGVQLDHCSYREYEAAIDRTRRVVQGALAGNVGAGTVVLVGTMA